MFNKLVEPFYKNPDHEKFLVMCQELFYVSPWSVCSMFKFVRLIGEDFLFFMFAGS